MKDYPLTIQSGETRRIVVLGQTIRMQSAAESVLIQAENKQGRTILDLSMTQGVRAGTPEPFTLVRATNNTSGALSIILTMGMGIVDDSSVTGTLEISKSRNIATSADQTIPGTSGAVIAPVNAARRELLVQSRSTNTAIIRVGDASTSATRGLEVSPGGVATISSTDKVHVYNPDIDAQIVAVLEVVD